MRITLPDGSTAWRYNMHVTVSEAEYEFIQRETVRMDDHCQMHGHPKGWWDIDSTLESIFQSGIEAEMDDEEEQDMTTETLGDNLNRIVIITRLYRAGIDGDRMIERKERGTVLAVRQVGDRQEYLWRPYKRQLKLWEPVSLVVRIDPEKSVPRR